MCAFKMIHIFYITSCYKEKMFCIVVVFVKMHDLDSPLNLPWLTSHVKGLRSSVAGKSYSMGRDEMQKN